MEFTGAYLITLLTAAHQSQVVSDQGSRCTQILSTAVKTTQATDVHSKAARKRNAGPHTSKMTPPSNPPDPRPTPKYTEENRPCAVAARPAGATA